MIDVFRIGVSIGLVNDASPAIRTIQRDLQGLGRVIDSTTARFNAIRRTAKSAFSGTGGRWNAKAVDALERQKAHLHGGAAGGGTVLRALQSAPVRLGLATAPHGLVNTLADARLARVSFGPRAARSTVADRGALPTAYARPYPDVLRASAPLFRALRPSMRTSIARRPEKTRPATTTFGSCTSAPVPVVSGARDRGAGSVPRDRFATGIYTLTAPLRRTPGSIPAPAQPFQPGAPKTNTGSRSGGLAPLISGLAAARPRYGRGEAGPVLEPRARPSRSPWAERRAASDPGNGQHAMRDSGDDSMGTRTLFVHVVNAHEIGDAAAGALSRGLRAPAATSPSLPSPATMPWTPGLTPGIP